MILITYQKRNGDIFQRVRNTYTSYRVGDETSMGWKVLDIKYKYKDHYYSYADYDRLIEKEWQKDKKLFQIKKGIKETLKNINRVMVFLILFKVFIFISNKAILELFSLL